MERFDCVRVNADYEQMLFHGRSGPRAMNEALEFLPLLLEHLPLCSEVSFSRDYLGFIEKITGRKPIVVEHGKARNWWGPLENIARERTLNSKLTSTKLAISEGWTGAKILPLSRVSELQISEPMVVKDPFGMSGKGVFLLWPGEKIELPKSVASELIVEPFLQRKYDFSHFIFPDNKIICYENMIDEKFQYRGSLFRGRDHSSVESLSFFSEIEASEWERFHRALEKIISHYGDPSPYGFSVDSLVYESEGKLRIYPLAEVNFRRTMGSCAFELTELIAPGKVAALSLKAPVHREALKLTPPGVRFEIFLSWV